MLFIIVLIAISILFFVLQVVLFHNVNEGMFLFVQDLWFLPINVIIVSFILDRFIALREKKEKLERLNILINDFFNEAGRDILCALNPFIQNLEEISAIAAISVRWKEEDFKKAVDVMEKAAVSANAAKGDLSCLRDVLREKKKNIMAMVENPSLLEHDRFTEMLWAVYHLADELMAREDFAALPNADMEHLSGDMKRAYRYLCVEWLHFNNYIKQKYPYLFSLAHRKSPFHKNSVVIDN
jgi:hypothetical protein